MDGINFVGNGTMPFFNVRTTTEMTRRINSDDGEGNHFLLYVLGGYAILCILCVIIYALKFK